MVTMCTGTRPISTPSASDVALRTRATCDESDAISSSGAPGMTTPDVERKSHSSARAAPELHTEHTKKKAASARIATRVYATLRARVTSPTTSPTTTAPSAVHLSIAVPWVSTHTDTREPVIA